VFIFHWKKVAEALFSDITSSAAGKRLLLRILRSQHWHIHVQQRDFCRLPRASFPSQVRQVAHNRGQDSMNSLRRKFIALLAVACLPAAAFAADVNVAGEWELAVETQMGTGTPHFILKQDGSTVIGTYKGQFGEAPVSGTVKGKDLSLSFKVIAQGMNYEMTYTGTVEGDTIRGKLLLGGAEQGTFTGKRT
jgi:hypothetical protein